MLLNTIKTRGVLVVLVVGLLSASSFAAEPTYDEFVTQIKNGNTNIDYAAFRYSYTTTPNYEPLVGASPVLKKEMMNAFSAGDCSKAMARAQEILETNFVQIAAHSVAGHCHKKVGNEQGARQELTVANGLLGSILKSGDGKTAASAYMVIAIEEEYAVLGYLGLPAVNRQLVSEQGSAFDRFETKAQGANLTVVYFNIDRMRAATQKLMRKLLPIE